MKSETPGILRGEGGHVLCRGFGGLEWRERC